MLPYKIQVQHEQTEADAHKWVVMCKWFEEKIKKSRFFGKSVV